MKKKKRYSFYTELSDVMKTKQKSNNPKIKENNYCKNSELESIIETNYNEAIRIQNKKLFIEENLNIILKHYESLSEEEVENMLQMVLKHSETI